MQKRLYQCGRVGCFSTLLLCDKMSGREGRTRWTFGDMGKHSQDYEFLSVIATVKAAKQQEL